MAPVVGTKAFYGVIRMRPEICKIGNMSDLGRKPRKLITEY